MSGPRNAIIGDNYGTDLPIMEVPEQDLTEERKAARFSKTKEFKALKTHFEERIAYYQAALPNGNPVLGEQDIAQLGLQWQVANAIIAEFKAVISAYEQASEVVSAADTRTD